MVENAVAGNVKLIYIWLPHLSIRVAFLQFRNQFGDLDAFSLE